MGEGSKSRKGRVGEVLYVEKESGRERREWEKDRVREGKREVQERRSNRTICREASR